MKHRLEYALVKAVFVVVRVMPDRLVRATIATSRAHFPRVRNAREKRLRAQPSDTLAACLSSS